jgi:hypothetical protein
MPNRISALISRLTHENQPGQSLSGKLDEPILGWLSIAVIFLAEPVSDMAVWFYNQDGVEQRNAEDPTRPKHRYYEPGDPNRNPAGWTDARGCFHITHQVPVGTYVCRLQGQQETEITTVEDQDDPFVVVLPIGRSYFDIYGRVSTGKTLAD